MDRNALFASPPLIEDPTDGSTAFDHVAHAAKVVAAVQPALDSGDPEQGAAMRSRLAELLASAVGRDMEDTAPDQFAELAAILPRLAAVARTIPVDVLSTFGGKPRQVLELLAEQADEGLLQIEIEQETGIPADYLSKVVRRLADADLIVRWAEGRNRRLVITGTGGSVLARDRQTQRAAAVSAVGHGEEAVRFALFETRHSAASLRFQAHGPNARPGSQWSAHPVPA